MNVRRTLLAERTDERIVWRDPRGGT